MSSETTLDVLSVAALATRRNTAVNTTTEALT